MKIKEIFLQNRSINFGQSRQAHKIIKKNKEIFVFDEFYRNGTASKRFFLASNQLTVLNTFKENSTTYEIVKIELPFKNAKITFYIGAAYSANRKFTTFFRLLQDALYTLVKICFIWNNRTG